MVYKFFNYLYLNMNVVKYEEYWYIIYHNNIIIVVLYIRNKNRVVCNINDKLINFPC